MLPVITGTVYQNVYFEYSSKGTYAPFITEVKILPDRTIKYKRTHLYPEYVHEEWTGGISENDYNTFIDEIMNRCDFMNLPSKADHKNLTKDSSTDEFSIKYGDKKHSIGGYDAVHYKQYQQVYESYRKIMKSAINKKYIVVPHKR